VEIIAPGSIQYLKHIVEKENIFVAINRFQHKLKNYYYPGWSASYFLTRSRIIT